MVPKSKVGLLVKPVSTCKDVNFGGVFRFHRWQRTAQSELWAQYQTLAA